MNRLILKYGGQITAALMVVFAWVVYRRIAAGGLVAVVPLAVSAFVTWAVGAGVFIYFWPRLTVTGIKRAIVRRGFGDGPIPVNTVYAVPDSPSETASTGSLIATGTEDLLYLCGWLDVREAPRLLHVPAMGDRYYSVQLTDPVSGANFAYVGKRTTGTAAGTFLLSRPDWAGDLPVGTARIDIPHGTALLIGRVFVAGDADRAAAFALAQQIRLSS